MEYTIPSTSLPTAAPVEKVAEKLIPQTIVQAPIPPAHIIEMSDHAARTLAFNRVAVALLFASAAVTGGVLYYKYKLKELEIRKGN